MCETSHPHPMLQTQGQIYGNSCNNREKDFIDHNSAVIDSVFFSTAAAAAVFLPKLT